MLDMHSNQLNYATLFSVITYESFLRRLDTQIQCSFLDNLNLHLALLQLILMDIGITVIICTLILAAGMGYIIFILTKRPKESEEDIEKLLKATQDENKNLKTEVSNKDEEIGELKSKIETANSENNGTKGQIKQLESNFDSLKSDHKIVQSEKDTLKEIVLKYKNEEEQNKKEHNENIIKLESATKALENEKNKIIEKELEKQEKSIKEMDRVWKEHENQVIAYLTELCRKQSVDFQFYDNNRLPPDWEGKSKPDFIIHFLKQYLIFDAKLSEEPERLQNYIANNQIKNTLEKIKNNPKIYPTIYFVVPSEAIGLINKFHYYEPGYNFFVITKEALEPLLLNLKVISKYDLADKVNPQDRDNIINIISEMDYHINLRNAVDLTVTQWGIDTLDNVKKIDENLLKEILLKKDDMNIKTINKAHLKNFMVNTKIQQDEINKLSTPVASIKEEDIKDAKKLLLEDNSGDNKNGH